MNASLFVWAGYGIAALALLAEAIALRHRLRRARQASSALQEPDA